jgi:phage baseplate assembly protein W
MSGTYTAFEFVHPDLGRRPGQGPPAPGEQGLRLAANRRLSLVNGDASVRQAILILLTTRPGERVMRPEYGCALHTLAFSPNDDTTAGLAIHYVRQALERWEPRVQILHLEAGRHPDQVEVLDVALQYRVLASNQVERLSVPVALTGKEA